ncbi:MAG: potassium transporter TrkA [Chromatiaceae bacterium]|nr:MAG: potassium transporter TrkA [Chromatiaceae bacterium]
MDPVFFLIFRRMRAPLLTLIVTYAVAVVGLTLIPGQDGTGAPAHMELFHAFYVMSYTSTTIGFGEIPNEFTDAQRIWVALCMYATVVVWLYSVGALLALAQDKALQRALRMRRFARRVAALRQPFYLICGYGQAGSGLVRALSERGQRVVVMDNNPERIDLLGLDNLPEFVPALSADVRRPDNLLLGGLRHPRCAGVLALTSANEVNLKVAITAKLMHPQITVMCRSDAAEVSANMASFGTDHIFDPFDIFARYLAAAVQSPCLTLLKDWLGEVRDSELKEPKHAPASGLWIICGYGRFGRALYRHLGELDLELTLIEPHPERTGKPPGRLVLGTGTLAETLREAGIERAVALVAATDNDTNNLSILLTARDLNPSLFTVIRHNQVPNQALFDAVAADIVMHPSLIVAHRIRTLLTTPLLADFIEEAGHASDGWACELVSRIAALVDDRVPEVWEIRIDAAASATLTALAQAGHALTLDALLQDPRRPNHWLPALVLLRRRARHQTLLPDLAEPVRRGDRLLLCGTHSARNRMGWLLQHPATLRAILAARAQAPATEEPTRASPAP